MSGIISYSGTFLQVFLPVFLGFFLALWDDRRKKKNREKDERNNTLETIKSELELNLQHLINMTETEESLMNPVRLNKLALNSSINSGSFALLDKETQVLLGEIYRTIDIIHMWNDKILAMVGSADMAMTSSGKALKDYRGNFVKVKEMLRRAIPKTIEHLDEKLGEK